MYGCLIALAPPMSRYLVPLLEYLVMGGAGGV